MNKVISVMISVVISIVFLGGCGSTNKSSEQVKSNNAVTQDKSTQAAIDNKSISSGQDSVEATIGQEFMTIKLEDGTAYTWDKGPERDELEGKIKTMLSTLTVKKVGIKKRPSSYVAMLFQNTSVIIPYGESQPEKSILIENDVGTYVGECTAQDLQAVLDWLKKHNVKIG